MRDANPIVVFVGGMAACMLMFVGLVIMGPGLVPSQLNACWVELEKQQKNCSSRSRGGKTYIKDSRCLTPSKGMFMLAEDESGWFVVGRQPTPSAAIEPDEDSDADEPNK